ncbi:methylmalonate-semialdehyde dehydrogenase [Klebsiella michiganensis]|uniref:Methylmalonate-semialdehyde dehydrogenase n=1 Tax=Klebsiella michiganensis TaxID=1134687 RepID=A0A7H4PQQ2_9ENTR|nr:methylmalonate-semialdehyde dehydrogenase [Klebsiella michiganensis]
MRQLTVPQRGLSTPRLAARANAAWRCRFVVVQEEIADKLIAAVVEKAKQLKIGPGYLRDTDMGPVISKRS